MFFLTRISLKAPEITLTIILKKKFPAVKTDLSGVYQQQNVLFFRSLHALWRYQVHQVHTMKLYFILPSCGFLTCWFPASVFFFLFSDLHMKRSDLICNVVHLNSHLQLIHSTFQEIKKHVFLCKTCIVQSWRFDRCLVKNIVSCCFWVNRLQILCVHTFARDKFFIGVAPKTTKQQTDMCSTCLLLFTPVLSIQVGLIHVFCACSSPCRGPAASRTS